MRKNLLFLLCCSRFIDKECFDGEQVNKETVSGTTSHSDFYHEYLQIYYRVFGGNCVFFSKSAATHPSRLHCTYIYITAQVLNAMRARARAGHFQCRRGRGGKILKKHKIFLKTLFSLLLLFIIIMYCIQDVQLPLFRLFHI